MIDNILPKKIRNSWRRNSVIKALPLLNHINWNAQLLKIYNLCKEVYQLCQDPLLL